MQSLEQLRSAVNAELGSELAELVRDGTIDRWLNEGQERLQSYIPTSSTLTIPAAAVTVALPADFVRQERIEGKAGYCLEPYRVWGLNLLWQDVDASVTAGEARLLYLAARPAITGSADSTLPAIGDQGCVSWALYRAYRWLASQRADYRAYATITQANGVDLSELDAIAERNKSDFEEAKTELAEALEASPYFP